MGSGLVAGSSFESEELQRSPGSVVSAKRRAYNREYMRAWRADPRHQARERAARQRAYFARKLREALRDRSPFTNDSGLPACGFCGRPPVAEILRLRICDHARDGYVPVRMPYCGEC